MSQLINQTAYKTYYAIITKFLKSEKTDSTKLIFFHSYSLLTNFHDLTVKEYFIVEDITYRRVEIRNFYSSVEDISRVSAKKKITN